MNSDKTSKEYATKDIASIVDIASPTVRKYAQALEKAGYKFPKNENGFRIFTDKDIEVFKEIKEISNSKGMPVEKIADMIVSNQRKEIRDESQVDTVKIIQSDSENSSHIVQYDSRYDELISKLDKLDMLDDIASELDKVKEVNKMLVERMEQQNEFIKQSLERRDQRIIEAIEGVQQKQQAQIEVAAEKEVKRGFFSRLFGK